MNSTRIKRIFRKLKSFKPVLEGSGIVSYSEYGEDIIIYKLLKRFNLSDITYIDIGANHPVRGSNTYFFYTLGHSGFLVEPNAELCNKLRDVRPKDTILNFGISNGDATEANYYMFAPDCWGMNTFSEKEAKHIESEGFPIKKVVKLPLRNINNIIKEYKIFNPTILSIDVEGLDEMILSELDFNLCKPFIICVESVSFTLHGEFKKRESLMKLIESKGYFVYADTHTNTIFCSREQTDKLLAKNAS
jgi:FkbM family methyltransferase